jgi:quinohemoprotein ethanol dehydrogenase
VDGRFVAYNAATGEELWRYATQAATLAGPISYEVDGEQYVAVLAGYGTVYFLNAGFAAPTEGNALNSRVHVFRLGGTATLPPLNLERLPMPVPPVVNVSAQTVAAGQGLYNVHCAVCHGAGAVTGGVLPDVRRSTVLADQDQWRAVINGAREPLGMPSFSRWISGQEAEAIRAYVAAEAQALYAEEQARP